MLNSLRDQSDFSLRVPSQVFHLAGLNSCDDLSHDAEEAGSQDRIQLHRAQGRRLRARFHEGTGKRRLFDRSAAAPYREPMPKPMP